MRFILIFIIVLFNFSLASAQLGEVFIPYATVEVPPIFPGCEEIEEKNELKKCFSSKIMQHIEDNYPQELKEEGRSIRVTVVFVVSKDGNIKQIQMRGGSNSIRNVVVKILENIPKIKPAMHEGENVNIRYNLPLRL